MSERFRSLTITVIAVLMAGLLVGLIVAAPSDVDRIETIGESIKCPVCQGESIANSPSQMARDMMALVEERVDAGLTDEEIVDELLASYSGAVLLDPPTSGATLILWLAPIAALAVGASVIIWWRRHPVPKADSQPDDRPRRLVPLLLLGGAFAAVVVVAGFFIQDRSGPTSGVADLQGQDLDEVSNETMEAVIASNADKPQVDGMRLALAERYYEVGDYRSAFPHYLEVAESQNATDPQLVTALVRLGWMAWLSDAPPADAVGLFDQALAIDDSSSTARYLKGRVIWCGSGDKAAAKALFDEILEDPDVDDEARAAVAADLEAIRLGQDCR